MCGRLFVAEARIDPGPVCGGCGRRIAAGRTDPEADEPHHRGRGRGAVSRTVSRADTGPDRAAESRELSVGQKINPIGFRTGITVDWKSRWYAPKAAYGEFLVEDYKIRKYIDERLNRTAAVRRGEQGRDRADAEEVRVMLHTARPGLVIGPKGAEVDKLREELEDLIDRKVTVNIVEIKNPDLDAQLVAEAIAEQLKKRGSFRRVMKMRCEATMQAGAKGIRILCSGRLGGAEMARTETQRRGSVPLQTLQANVDYGYADGHTTYGHDRRQGVDLPGQVRRGDRWRSRAEDASRPRVGGGVAGKESRAGRRMLNGRPTREQ